MQFQAFHSKSKHGSNLENTTLKFKRYKGFPAPVFLFKSLKLKPIQVLVISINLKAWYTACIQYVRWISAYVMLFFLDVHKVSLSGYSLTAVE